MAQAYIVLFKVNVVDMQMNGFLCYVCHFEHTKKTHCCGILRDETRGGDGNNN